MSKRLVTAWLGYALLLAAMFFSASQLTLDSASADIGATCCSANFGGCSGTDKCCKANIKCDPDHPNSNYQSFCLSKCSPNEESD
jgi:hypothetical protein